MAAYAQNLKVNFTGFKNYEPNLSLTLNNPPFWPEGNEEQDEDEERICLSLPEISVLMPTYNYASYIGEAIESVLAQDFEDFELLICDDCSGDDTAAVVKPFCDRDERIRFTANSANLGMVANWNHCLAEARGAYVKFLFGDDKLSDPRALTKLVALLRNHPAAILAASARTILDEKSNVIDIWRPLPDGCRDGREVILAWLIEDGNLIGEPSSVLFRKADAQRGFDPKFRQIVDVEMWFHLLEKGALVYTREPLCAFRQHALQRSAINDDLGLAWKERALFFASYARKPWVSRKARFSALFALRRGCRKHSGKLSAELADAEVALAKELGQGWYWFHWVRYRLARPFHSLKRWIEKTRVRSTLSARRP